MTQKFYAIVTNLGAAKIANAAALGTKLNITQMAVGDGGGTLPTPNASQTKLVNEVRRAAINTLSIDPANASQVIAEQVIPETEGGFWIREMGLFDADGTLIAVCNTPETYKPALQEGSGRTQTVRMLIIVNSTDAITLKIDPSVVLATRKYVDDNILTVRQYADQLLADHVAAANPHNQYPLIKNALKEMADAGLLPDVLKNLGISEKFSGRLLKVNRFADNATYSKPAARLLKITVTGGGGGGGGAAAAGTSQGAVGSGGGAGGTAISWYAVDDLQFPVTLTVGKGGAGGVGTVEPQPGQSSSFGSYLSGANGARGASGSVFNYGEYRLLSNGGGGTGYGGNHMNIRGGAGGPAITLSNGYESGGGGSSFHSAGGNPIAAGAAYFGESGLLGSGGSGAFSVSNSSAQTGGKGGDGIIIVEEYA